MNHRSKLPAHQALFFALAVLAAGLTDSTAAGLPRPLTRDLAMKLIAEFYEVGPTEIKIAFILEGKMKKDDFETTYGSEATFIRTIVEDGRRRRRSQSLKFLYDESLGWFLSAKFSKDGRTYIDICSEHKGRIRIE